MISITKEQAYLEAEKNFTKDGASKTFKFLKKHTIESEINEIHKSDMLLFAHRLSVKNPSGALEFLKKLQAIDNQHVGVKLLSANIHDSLGQHQESIAYLKEVIEAKNATDQQVLSACNLLIRFKDDENIVLAAKKAFVQMGKPLSFASDLLYIALKIADWKTASIAIEVLHKGHKEGRTIEARESPRTNLLWCGELSTNIAVVKEWNKKSLPVSSKERALTLEAPKNRRLRVGYLSSDFREHPTSRLINGLLRNHNREKIELFMYCSGWNDGSALRKEIESHFEHIHSVTTLSNEDAAHLIRSHHIDVLVELNGPTRANRMGVLSHRAAPVQIDYLGFAGSVGGRAIDYIVGDYYTIPEGEENLYPEKVIRIEQIYQINDYANLKLPPVPLRSEVGLPQDALVLGMFNAINKVRDEVWNTWMEILKAVPNAILWILDPGQTARENIAKATIQAGVNPKRIHAARSLNQEAHLARLQCCDLMLDPWPYGGHTSTGDALFAGVPVIAMKGDSYASRVSGGLLKAAGLEILVQPDTKSYVQKAIKLLTDSTQRENIKLFLKEKVPSSDVFNAFKKTRQLEAAYLFATQRAYQGEQPMHLKIEFSAKPPVQKKRHHEVKAQNNSFKIPLILVLGPWSSGTSATAGMLAKAGLNAPGPYVSTNDPRTQDTYEMKAFQQLLQTLASESTMKLTASSEMIYTELANFHDSLLPCYNQQLGIPIMLKHALAAMVLPQLCEVFDTRIVGVLRPLEQIETTKQRRKWGSQYGKDGASVVYKHLFDYILESNIAFKLVRFTDVLHEPQKTLEKLLHFCNFVSTPEQRQDAIAFVSLKGA